MALAATPNEYVQRSLDRHEPLDGISSHEPGTFVDGQRLQYDEENLEGQDEGFYSDNEGTGRSRATNIGKGDMVEMKGSAGGVVEYSEDVDEVDDLAEAKNHVGASSSSESGILGGLKKRLSVRRK